MRRHSLLLRHTTRTQDGTQRLQQSCRMQFRATMSSMMSKRELLPRHHIIFFKRGDRVESSKEQEPVPSTSVMSEIAPALHLLLLTALQLYHLLPPLPLAIRNSSFLSLDASPICQLLDSTTVLFKVLYYKIKDLYFCVFVFMY